MKSNNSDINLNFLKGGGVMGEMIRNQDWSTSPLGMPQTWPQSLKTSISIVLHSRFPMLLFWGPEHVYFYNDALIPSLTTHSEESYAIAIRGISAWPEKWHAVKPTLDGIMAGGEPLYMENLNAPIEREGKMVNAYWTFSYSGVIDESGAISGVIVTSTETTKSALNSEQLIKTSQRLENLFTQINAGIVQTDTEGKYVEVNERFCQMLGYSREELLDMTMVDVNYPDDHEHNMLLFKECVEHGKDFFITKRYIRKNGSILWVNNSVSLVTDADGRKFITAVSVDITKEKEQEQHLIASESKFRSLIEESPVSTCLLVGPDMRVEVVNDIMLGYWGKDASAIGKPLAEAVPELKGQPFLDILNDIWSTGETYEEKGARAELLINGEMGVYYFDYIYKPLRNAAGEIYGIMNMSTDVTEQVLAQQKIAESQRELLIMFEESPVAIATISATEDLVFQWANPFYANIVGREHYEIIGKPLLEVIPELAGQGFDHLLKEVIATGIPYVANEVGVDILRKDRLEKIYVNLNYQPIKDKKGLVTGVMAVIIDVTQQVISRKQVEASENKLRGLIAAAPAGIGLFVGRDLIIENPNQTFIDIVGKGPHIEGLPLREAMPELLTEGQPFLKILDEVFTTGVPFNSPASLVKIVQNGVLNDNYYNISYTPVYNADGEVYAVLDIAIDVTGQVVAQQALAESEAHLQLLRNTVPAMIFYLDADQRYRSYNVVFMEWFGINSQEVIGKSVQEFLGDKVHQKLLPHLRRALAGEVERFEMKIPFRLGVEKWLSIVYTPHKTETGQVLGLIIHATDISQSKLNEMALRDSEARFRSLIEKAPVATCVFTGRDMRVTLANELMLSYWGKDHAILNLPLAEAVPSLVGQPFLEILDKVYTTGETYEAKNERAEIEINGVIKIFYFDYTYKALRDDGGEIYGVMDMAVDVTDEVLSRQKLEEKESALQNAIKLAELGTWSMDIATGVSHFSQKHADMFGLDHTCFHVNEVLGIIHADDRERVKNAFIEAQECNDGKFDEEYRIINCKTGKQQIIHSLGEVYCDDKDVPIHMSGTAQDITIQRELQMALENQVQKRTEELAASNEELQSINEELAESNEALINSNEALAQYAYVASHDLQEPLRKISTFTQMLESSLGNTINDKSRQYFDKIYSSSNRMRKLISDVLEYSKLVKEHENFEEVDLNEILKNIISEYDLSIEQLNARITIDPLPTIDAIPHQMSQLFRNLLGNALKFSRKGLPPEITISLKQVSIDDLHERSLSVKYDYCKIEIQDNGIGVLPEYAEKIFSIFKRLHSKSEYEGTGIGLAMCKKIVLNHHGDIHAIGSEGNGTTFVVILPMKHPL